MQLHRISIQRDFSIRSEGKWEAGNVRDRGAIALQPVDRASGSQTPSAARMPSLSNINIYRVLVRKPPSHCKAFGDQLSRNR